MSRCAVVRRRWRIVPDGAGSGAAPAAPARRDLVQRLDHDREPDRGVDVSLRHVKPDTVGDQRRADQQQEAQRQHLDRRVPIDEGGERSRRGDHDQHGDDDRRRHHPQLVRHPDRGDHAVEREHDVEHHDLRDDAGKARRGPGGAGVLVLALEPFVDLARALVEQKQPAGDQDDVAPGEPALEQLEYRRRQPDDPGDRREQREAGQHRQRQPEPPRQIPPVLRQPADQDRDKDEIVDAEHDLERGQRHETGPELRVGQPLHRACFPIVVTG